MNFDVEWADAKAAMHILKKTASFSEEQVMQYSRLVYSCRDRIFKGRVGNTFLRLWKDSILYRDAAGLASLRSDVGLVYKSIYRGRDWNLASWHAFYQFCREKNAFKTECGRVFLWIIGVQLVSELPQQEKEPARSKQKTARPKRKKRGILVPLLSILAFVFFGIWLFLTVRSDQSRLRLAFERSKVQEQAEELEQHLKRLHNAIAMAGHNAEEPVVVLPKETKEKPDAKQPLKEPEVLEQYKEFYESHPTLYGWLKIEDTELDLPVMRADGTLDAGYYLDHSYDDVPDEEGALFVDPDCGFEPGHRNIVVYGHNMRNGEMFGCLKQYEGEAFFRAHSVVWFDTLYETGKFEIIAVLRTRILNEGEAGFRYYQLFRFETEQQYKDCEAFINQNRIHGQQIQLTKDDELLMLSTCEYTQDNGRLVVVGRRIVDSE